MTYIFFLFLHHLADTMQPTWLIKNKKKHAFAVYEHAFVWAGLITIALFCFGEYALWKFLFLLIGHFLIDFIKYRYFKNYQWVYLDQGLHYLQIIIVLNL